MSKINVAKARELCSDSEWALVRASGPKEIGRLSPAQLKSKLNRAQKLRDKWQDVATKQRRQTQRAQAARVTDKNARSQEKGELFAEVAARFQARSEKLAAEGKTAPARPKSTKKLRNATHRAERADTRQTLAEQRQELKPARTKPSRPEPVTRKSNAPKAVATEQASTKAATTKAATTKTTATKTKPSKKVARKKPSPAVSAGPDAVKLVPSRQRAAKTVAKRNRVAASGLTSRVRGHVSAAVKRKQAKRDKG